ncbi:MAG: MFS transporter [Candidatus Heimdallarchaeota archaeon]|nr:MFS transporter [Candidatus Heimdallarchaeota archaeon]
MSNSQKISTPDPENAPTSVIKNPDFLKILFGGLISDIGTYFTFIAIIFYTLKLSLEGGMTVIEAGQMVALITIVQLIPSILVGPFAGVVVDRFDRKKIMVLSDVIGGTSSLVLIFVNQLWQIYLLTGVYSIIRVFFYPARGAAFPLIVEKEGLMQANGMIQITAQISKMIGPALAGVIIGFLGYNTAFIIDAISFYISSILLFTITKNLNVENKGDPQHVITDFKQGFTLSFKDPIIGFIIVILIFTMLAIGAIDPLFVLYLTQYFGLGEADFGYILSLSAISGFLSAILMTTLGKNLKRKITFMLLSIVVMGISMTIIAYASVFSSIPMLYLGMILVGVINVLFSIPLNALVQTIVEPKHLGKVSAFLSTTIIISQLSGAVLSTQLLTWFSIDDIYFVVGFGLLFIGFLSLILAYSRNIEYLAQRREAESMVEGQDISVEYHKQHDNESLIVSSG